MLKLRIHIRLEIGKYVLLSSILNDMKMENIYVPISFTVSCVGDSMYAW